MWGKFKRVVLVCLLLQLLSLFNSIFCVFSRFNKKPLKKKHGDEVSKMCACVRALDGHGSKLQLQSRNYAHVRHIATRVYGQRRSSMPSPSAWSKSYNNPRIIFKRLPLRTYTSTQMRALLVDHCLLHVLEAGCNLATTLTIMAILWNFNSILSYIIYACSNK